MEKIRDIVVIPDNTKYWLMRANSGEFYADFKTNNFIAIDGNEVALSQLKNIEDKMKINTTTFKNSYKQIFNRAYSEKIKSDEISQHSISLRSNQTFMFIEQMTNGDIVLVPSRSSTHLLIGVIISDASEDEINRSVIFDEDDFEICEYNKKRRVLWIKEIQKEELPNNMLGIINTHQGLLNLDHYSEQINSIISLFHYYKDNLFFTIRVQSLEPIDSVTWLNFQKLIVEYSGNAANHIYQKKSVESPGEITLETIAKNWEAFVIIFAILFGDVNYKGFRFRGLISRFFPYNKKMDALEIERLEADIAKTNAEAQKINIESEKIFMNIQQIQRIEDEYSLDLENSYKINKKIKTDLTSSKEKIESIKKMNLSNDEFGNEIPKKNQMDNLNI